MEKRSVDIVVISDVHLGTYGCHAKELVNYLKSIKPQILILNGDIIDIWQFSKRFWPKSHMEVIKQLVSIMAEGTPVYYLTGNHDEMLRKFSDFNLSNFKLADKLVIEIDNKKAWIFHGDIFDATMTHAKFIAKLGGFGYDLLILINRFVNFMLSKLGQERMSFSKKIKNSVKQAVSHIQNFEKIAADIAIENNYDYVICGHIHQPQKRAVSNENGSVLYLNSGDWVESLTALEYTKGEWEIFQYDEKVFGKIPSDKRGPELVPIEVVTKEISFQLNTIAL
jgi:UDP-2,3-diacylglucosamine pyrophosphatase LpxH